MQKRTGISTNPSSGYFANAQVKPTPAPVQQALETGNALLVSDPIDFIRESRQVVEGHKKQSNTIKSAIAKNLSGYSPNTGNPNLKEETADTYTFGITVSPEFLDGFNLAVDYYDIAIVDAIDEISNASHPLVGLQSPLMALKH